MMLDAFISELPSLNAGIAFLAGPPIISERSGKAKYGTYILDKPIG